MRRRIAGTLTVLSIFCHGIAASAAPTEPRNATTTFADRARAYVATVNAGDADAVERDHVYGQLHGVELALDGPARNRLSDFELADAAPAWGISRQGAPAPNEVAERSRDIVRRGCSAGVFSGAALVA